MTENKALKRKAIVYIDGFNLYFALDEKNWHSFKWLDLIALSKGLIRSDQELVTVKYFTARIANDPDKQKRQTAFLDALGTLSNLEIFYGNYQQKTIICNRCGRSWDDSKEKQTDVSIATQMLLDAHKPDCVDDIILVTADSDQCPAMEAVRSLGKKILVVLPPGRGHYLEVQMAADARLELTAKKFKKCLLPAEVTTQSGFVIKRPKKYDPI